MLALCTTVIVSDKHWWKCVLLHALTPSISTLDPGECKRLAVIQEAGLWK